MRPANSCFPSRRQLAEQERAARAAFGAATNPIIEQSASIVHTMTVHILEAQVYRAVVATNGVVDNSRHLHWERRLPGEIGHERPLQKRKI